MSKTAIITGVAEENVCSIRPGYGLHPKYYHEVLGKKASEDIKEGTALDFKLIK
jgi:pseudaminic acid synthase